jgi:hypothetical protein
MLQHILRTACRPASLLVINALEAPGVHRLQIRQQKVVINMCML